jgi:hypothetical protein
MTVAAPIPATADPPEANRTSLGLYVTPTDTVGACRTGGAGYRSRR